jgi:3-oxoacyl-[acyl-carrier-protein] synthase II
MPLSGWNIPFTIIANACASGTNAVGEAYRLVRSGIRNCLLCGGYDALSELVYLGFDCLQASTQEKVRPFDRDRTGLALGEGAALVIVESYESARARNAPVLGEIIGYGLATDNYHLTQPHPSGIGPQRSMQRAFEDAGLNGDGVDYVNAHGTATRFNDSTEAIAIRSVTPDAVVSSTKSMMGHALGAAGAVEMVFSLLSLAEGFVPPNINFQQGDSETPLHIAEKPVSRVLTRVASNSFGFGGTNATIVLASQKAGPELPSPASDNGSGVFIAGMGWVTPAGGDLRTVLDRLRANIPCDPKPVECLTYNRPLRAISVDPGLTQHLGRHPRLRRASPISYYAVAAGTAAMEHAGIAADPERTAVVFAAATGSVQYTRRFYEGILREGAPGASPVLFPETVYNAPASHLAAALGITGPTLTLVGDGSIGLTALQFGADLLESDHGIDHVLVVGAEEMDPATVAAYSDWELFQPEESPGSVALSEGGAAVVLARTGPWELVGACGGIPFRRRSGRAVLEETLFRFRQASPSCVYAGFNGTPCDALERDVIEAVFPESPIRAIKHILGEPLGAGALMQTIAACLESAEGYHAGREAVVTSAGLNRQFGAAWIRHCGGGLA